MALISERISLTEIENDLITLLDDANQSILFKKDLFGIDFSRIRKIIGDPIIFQNSIISCCKNLVKLNKDELLEKIKGRTNESQLQIKIKEIVG